jgi:MerR family mercuric resistance operon transcriptional regulator
MSKAAVSKDVSRYFEVIPDFAAFMDADGQALEFPLTISQLGPAGAFERKPTVLNPATIS